MQNIKSLSDIVTLITRGVSPNYHDNGYIIINQRCIRSFRVDFSLARFSSKEKTRVNQDKFVRRWDALVNSTGVGTLGRVAQLKRQVSNTTVDSHVTIVRPDLQLIDGNYFGYLMFDKQHLIANLGEGATGQTELARSRLAEIEVEVPAIPTQRKIAAILSAYDDLIENNLRRIKILEEMAQNLYWEWFVKFRFPGHEKVMFVDSEMGRIPEGWDVKRLSETCTLIMGQSPKSEFYNTVGTGLPFHQGVTDFGSRFPKDRIFCTVKNRVAEPGDILFSVRAPVGRINLSDKKFVIGRGLSAIRENSGNQWFLFHFLKDAFQKEDTMGGGAIFNSVTKKDMEEIPILYPTKGLVEAFERVASPPNNEAGVLTKKNNTIRQTRDFLLPRLISGEVDVSELDITIPIDNQL